MIKNGWKARKVMVNIMKETRTLEQVYAGEPWGKLAIAAGFNPVDTESQTRRAFAYCAETIDSMEKALQDARDYITQQEMNAELLKTINTTLEMKP